MPFVLIALVCLADVSTAAHRSEVARDEANNFICGPRCVKRILEYYGQTVELIDLVRELQGVAIDRPANLADMKQALERRGLHSLGVRIRPTDLPWLDWPDPVIAQLDHGGSATEHFCVLLGDGEAWCSIRVWDGLAGESTRPSGKLAADASGFLLLTSRSPIRMHQRCLSWRRFLLPLGVAVVITPAMIFATARALRRVGSTP
jgi:ABC-type bacteriocin/lantibiotic exporter with double-glycine peptidase domain